MPMHTFVIVTCIVIVLLHGVVAAIRYHRHKSNKSGRSVLSYVLTVLALGLLIVMRIPAVEERMTLWIAPKMIALGAAAFLFLLEFLAATTLVRMLMEQFVLHVPYKKLDWLEIILFNVAVAVFLIVHCLKNL